MKETVWYKAMSGNLYMYEELKLAYMEKYPNEKFELCNFIAWADKNGFKRIN